MHATGIDPRVLNFSQQTVKATETTATAARERKRAIEDLPVGTHDISAGGMEESAKKSAEWSGEDMEELLSEEEAKISGGYGRLK